MMNDFHHDLQMLRVGDFYATQPVSWNQSQYYPRDERFLGFGACFGFGCFGCFGCGGCFRCGRCGFI